MSINSSYAGGIGRRISVFGWPRAKTQDSTKKISKANKNLKSQVVELLPSKQEARSPEFKP
jgi:hypothetical protein